MTNNITAMDGIKLKLAPLYNIARRWSYAEECLLLELSRVPEHMQEVDLVVQYWETLPSQEKRFFPNSMLRLLNDWCSILDTIAVKHRATASPKLASISEKIHLGYELKRVEARVKELRKILDNEMSETPTPEHRIEIKKLKARRQELLTTLNLSC